MSSPDANMVPTMLNIWVRLRRSSADLLTDCSGIAAIEFAIIVPIMLLMFFGTIEFSSGVAVDRKVTLVARTLSDLTSQSTSVNDFDLANFTTTGKAILTPYSTAPLNSTITELYVDPNTKAARVQWSQGSAPRGTGTTVTIPAELQVAGTYLIYSEVSYLYVPAVGYVMAKAGINLSDSTYTRPRQSACVIYPTPASGALPSCPIS
jgi:Flp pilus assembly protein TadG